MQLEEHLLQFIWQFKKLPVLNLVSTLGERIQIIEVGYWNHDSGPDFLDARLKIGDTLWSGNVEIHWLASDWNKHGHCTDKAYNSVVLHVVWEDDGLVESQSGQTICTLEIGKLIDMKLFDQFRVLFLNRAPFPCFPHLHLVDFLNFEGQIQRSSLDRIMYKSDQVMLMLRQNKGDWERTAYHLLMRNAGSYVNSLPFEMLSKVLPLNSIKRAQGDLHVIEALMFGQAGFLTSNSTDPYILELKQTYLFLKKKHRFAPLPLETWKFMRMRPANFPTLRLAQMSAFFSCTPHLMPVFMEWENVLELKQLFEDLPVSSYWETHYNFKTEGPWHSAQMGRHTVHSILINTVVTLLFTYGKHIGNVDYVEKAIDLLAGLPVEQNRIVRMYNQGDFKLNSALQSQGALQLYHNYCKNKKCLKCKVGVQLMG